MLKMTQRRMRIGIVTISAIGALLFMYHLRAVFNPFLLALALAYILNPLVKWMERRGIPRKIGIGIIFISMLLSVAVAILLIVPRLYREAVYWRYEVVGEPFKDNNGNHRFDAKLESQTFIDKNGNGKYDPPEEYTDLNGNGVFDPRSEAATLEDANKNGKYDSGEKFDDFNHNGKFDSDIPADPFVDRNGNGKWDKGEPFDDQNKNGRMDRGQEPDSWIRAKHDLNGNGKFDEGYPIRIVRWLKSEKVKNNAFRRFLSQFGTDEEIQKAIEDGVASLRDNISMVFKRIGDITFAAWSGALKSMGWIWNAGLLLLLTPIYLAFLLNSIDKVWESTTSYIPGKIRPRFLDIMRKIDLVISAFFRGRLLVCFCIGVFTALGFAIVGVKFGVLFGLAIGILSFIPFLNILGLMPALLSCYMNDFTLGGYAAVIVVFALGQAIDPLLTSVVLGKDLELHPLTILLSLFACSALLGFFGMLLAVPIVATAKILGKEFVMPHLEALAKEKPDEKGGS